MATREWLIVWTGGYRLAVAADHIAGIRRAPADESSSSLAALLGESSVGAEDTVLTIRHATGESPVCVGGADVRAGSSPFALPAMLRGMTHPSIIGLALDDTNLVPVVDPARLIDL